MQIKIYGETPETQELLQRVNFCIEDLGLTDFVKAEIDNSETLKQELNISQVPALVIEEESIDFKDMIFEGIVPDIEELKSMFISIIGGWDEGGWCWTGGCGSCSSSGGCSTEGSSEGGCSTC